MKWGMPRWGIATMVTIFMLLIHATIGKLDNGDGWLWNLTDSIYLGLFTWLLLFCATRADEDLQTSSLLISDESWAQRSLSIRDARVETAIALFVGISIAGVAWFVETVDADIYVDRAIGERVAIFIRWVIDSSLFIHLISMILRHRHWLQGYINNDLKIDLLRVDELNVLSSGFVTWIAVEACVIGLYVLAFAFLKDPNPYELLRIFVGTGLIAIIVLLLFTPILQTRTKVITAKELERSIATQGLQGIKIKAGDLSITSEGEYYSPTELLSYLHYLDSIWNWPIRRNLAQLGFYALIPPVAWVLSALVEISLSVQLE